ncbi:hypothetical protein [Bradyrhizobium liaoningense]
MYDALHHGQRESQDRRGAVTAVVMTAVLFAIATGFLLARQVDEMPDRNQRRASLVLDPCGSGKKTETSFCW